MFSAVEKSANIQVSFQLYYTRRTLNKDVYFSVCGVQHFERAQRRWGTFKSLWFVVVTFSTVGYGDSVPADWPAQTFVMFSIFMALIILPMQVGASVYLNSLFIQKPKALQTCRKLSILPACCNLSTTFPQTCQFHQNATSLLRSGLSHAEF